MDNFRVRHFTVDVSNWNAGKALQWCSQNPATLVSLQFRKSFPYISSVSCHDTGYPALRHGNMEASCVGRILERYLVWSMEWKNCCKGKSRHEQRKKRQQVHLGSQMMLEVHSRCIEERKEDVMTFFLQICNSVRRAVSCNISSYLWLMKNPITVLFNTHKTRRAFCLNLYTTTHFHSRWIVLASNNVKLRF